MEQPNCAAQSSDADDKKRAQNKKVDEEEEEEGIEGESQPTISKRQMKKKQKFERILAKRKERRKEERQKLKEKRRAELATGVPAKKAMFYSMNESNCRIRIAVDMAFDDLMEARTVKKAISQLAYCYSTNRRSPNPLQFFIINVTGTTKEIIDSIPSYRNWDAHFKYESLTSLWMTNEIVYLTADSENLLEKLEEDKVYVIGGLLDHNHHKGVCLKKAQQNGYAHARLPIDSYFRLSGRQVLTINQVFEILVHVSHELDWEEAFTKVIPKRKGIESTREDDEEDGNGKERSEEDELEEEIGSGTGNDQNEIISIYNSS